MKKVAIIGAAGYVARELIGCLARHPFVKITQAVSSSQHGKSVSRFHKDPVIPKQLIFGIFENENVDVLFLCGGHGFSKRFLSENSISENILIIDLSMDFRNSSEFVYGLPEVLKGNFAILRNRIANPGCFATAIQLGILPTLGIQDHEWHIHALTGSSGAGQELQTSSHFTWRENNVSTYKVFAHQHEIELMYNGQQIAEKQGKVGFPKLWFTPLRGPFTRGIFATMYTTTSWTQEEAIQRYKTYYENSAFTIVTEEELDLKQVVGTNYCLIQPRVIDGVLFVTSIIDNLLKGAAGQAIQNMNNCFGFPETSGLQFKPTYI